MLWTVRRPYMIVIKLSLESEVLMVEMLQTEQPLIPIHSA